MLGVQALHGSRFSSGVIGTKVSSKITLRYGSMRSTYSRELLKVLPSIRCEIYTIYVARRCHNRVSIDLRSVLHPPRRDLGQDRALTRMF